MIEPNEWIGDPTTGYQPDDPPQGEHWCSECFRWDDECECGEHVKQNARNSWTCEHYEEANQE